MVISIEKNTEMNLDMDSVNEIIFLTEVWFFLYRLELDWISECFCSSTLN